MLLEQNKREYNRQWAARHRDAVRKSHNAWSQRNRQYLAEYNCKFGAENSRVWRFNLKVKILTHYGNDELACVECGFSDLRALSIDHINGNGSSHRKEIGNKSGNAFYRWLEKSNFPGDYQTLCMNCQFIKAQNKKEVIAK